MSGFQVRKYSQNETICKEGATGTAAYILRKGKVEVSVDVEGNKKVLTILEPVTVFGEMALLLKDHKRTATAIALEYSEIVEIEKKYFDEYIGESPLVIATALKALVERLLDTTSRLKKHEELNIYG